MLSGRALVWIAQILTVYRVVLANDHTAREYRIAYALFGVLAVITSTFAISQRIRHFCQVRSQVSDAMSQDSDTMQRSESSLMSRLKWELVKNSRDYRYRAIELFLLLLEDLPMVRDYRLAGAFQWSHAVWCTDPVRVVTPTVRLRCSSLGDFEWPAGFQGGQPGSIGPYFCTCLEAFPAHLQHSSLAWTFQVIFGMLFSGFMVGTKMQSLQALIRLHNRRQELQEVIEQLETPVKNVGQRAASLRNARRLSLGVPLGDDSRNLHLDEDEAAPEEVSSATAASI